MGNIGSTDKGKIVKGDFDPAKMIHHVFKDDVAFLNDIVGDIMSNTQYVKDDSKCEDYTLILEEELKKHLKVELVNLKQHVFFVKKTDNVRMHNGKQVNKQALCKSLARHYNKVLKLLKLVKNIYDIEHGGDYSIAGICLRNVIVLKDLMEIHFCGKEHMDGNKTKNADSNGDKNPNLIDFNKMHGMQLFLEEILTKGERNTFVHNIQFLLNREDTDFQTLAKCHGDELVGKNLYKSYDIGSKDASCNHEQSKKMAFTIADTDKINSLRIAAGNPVFHADLCTEDNVMVIQTNVSDENMPMLLSLHKQMKSNYKKNIDDLKKILFNSMLDTVYDDATKRSKYVLKNLTSRDISTLRKNVSQTIALLFYRSLMDYYALLEQAKKVPHLLVSNGSLQKGGRGKRTRTSCRKGVQGHIL
jgi:hypothetical protein